MTNRDDVVETIRSGDPDAVNALVDDLEDAKPANRLQYFEDCFDALVDAYDAGDGYQRQSIVRVLDALKPAFSVSRTRDEADEMESSDHPDREAVLDRAAAFHLAALRDDDGRVRIAARRALKQLCVGFHHLGDDEAIDAVVAELDGMLDEIDDERARHVEEAREDVTYFRRSFPPDLFDAVGDALEES